MAVVIAAQRLDASDTRHARVAPGRVRLLGVGLALPGQPLSTAALCEQLERRFGVPARRMGRRLESRLQVYTRHICRDFEQAIEAPRAAHRNAALAVLAAQQALSRANLAAPALGYLLTHTATPGQALPGGSAEVAQGLGWAGPHAEFRQACTGFASALQMAFALLREPGALPVLIVGSEVGSVYFDPTRLAEDPAQWVNALQMGDGAAAVLLGADSEATGPRLSSAYFGQMPDPPAPGLQLVAGGSDHVGLSGVAHFDHDFDGVRRHGLALLEAGHDVLAAQGHALAEAQWVIPHQASGRVAEVVAEHFGLALDRVSKHGQRVGNLGSASIWAALADAFPHLRPGDTALVLGAEATQHSYGGFALHR